MQKRLRLSEVVFREDLYPRITPNPAQIQQYAENLEVLPPIEVNQHNILIDGFHRWTAHKKAEAEFINAVVIETQSDIHLLSLAIEKNAKHGLQLSIADKKKMAIRLYASGTGLDKEQIKDILSISRSALATYLTDNENKKFDTNLVKFLSVFEYKYKDCEDVRKAMQLQQGSAAYAEFMLAKIIGARFFFVIATYGKPPFTFYEFDMNTGIPYEIEKRLMYELGNETDITEKIVDFWQNVLHLK